MTTINEEELQDFVKQNKDLIARMMELQKGAAIEVASAGRDIARDVVVASEQRIDAAKDRSEEFARSVYSMFTDPEVQKHFMAMGMEFMMGLGAMMQKAPMPDFMKDAVQSTEQNLKQSACSANGDCGVRKKVEKVDIGTDAPKKVEITTPEE